MVVDRFTVPFVVLFVLSFSTLFFSTFHILQTLQTIPCHIRPSYASCLVTACRTVLLHHIHCRIRVMYLGTLSDQDFFATFFFHLTFSRSQWFWQSKLDGTYSCCRIWWKSHVQLADSVQRSKQERIRSSPMSTDQNWPPNERQRDGRENMSWLAHSCARGNHFQLFRKLLQWNYLDHPCRVLCLWATRM